MSNETWVFGPREGKAGPTHYVGEYRGTYQAWCGSRAQFRHRIRIGTAEEATCTTCIRQIKVGRPRARTT